MAAVTWDLELGDSKQQALLSPSIRGRLLLVVQSVSLATPSRKVLRLIPPLSAQGPFGISCPPFRIQT